jgi:hypothetical protein
MSLRRETILRSTYSGYISHRRTCDNEVAIVTASMSRVLPVAPAVGLGLGYRACSGSRPGGQTVVLVQLGK